MTVPVILANALAPPPLGAKANGRIPYGTTSVALTLQSAAFIGSVEWSVVPPHGSTCAVASASPTTPYSTTLGPFDLEGLYFVYCKANGNAAGNEITGIALMVPSRMAGLDLMGQDEQNEWDVNEWWLAAMRQLIQYVDRPGVATVAMADSNQTPLAAIYANEVLVCTGALTANRNLVLPHVAHANRAIVNATTGGFSVVVKSGALTGFACPAGVSKVYCSSDPAVSWTGTAGFDRTQPGAIGATTPAAGTFTDVTLGGVGGPQKLSGSGSPEGSVVAVVGSTYQRTIVAGQSLVYEKKSGSGNTGWVPTGGGFALVSLADANYTLTAAQYVKRFLRFSGTLTAGRTITMPADDGAIWHVYNATTQTLTFTCGGGTAIVTANARATIVSDGSGMWS